MLKFHSVLRETNLKVKQCLDDTNALGEDERSLSEFCGHILCEPPNNNLGREGRWSSKRKRV
jgi:hypothetical protein